MLVSDKIMTKVADREKYNTDLKRCLDTSICPQCGANLKRENVDKEEYLTEIKYTCPKCQFTATRAK